MATLLSGETAGLGNVFSTRCGREYALPPGANRRPVPQALIVKVSRQPTWAVNEVFPRLTKIWADSKYHNHQLHAWMASERPSWDLEIVSRPPGTKGFVLLPKRWVIERTFSWHDRCRRHSKDYERRPDSSEAMLKVSAMGLMLRRRAPANNIPKFNYCHAA